jgi:hypothetical protein
MRYVTAVKGTPQIRTTHMALLTFQGPTLDMEARMRPNLANGSWCCDTWTENTQLGFVVDGPLPDLRAFPHKAAPYFKIPAEPPARDLQPRGWGRLWLPFEGTHLQVWECTMRLKEAGCDLQVLIGHTSILNSPTTLIAQYAGRAAMVAAMTRSNHILILDNKTALLDTSLDATSWTQALTTDMDNEDRILHFRWRRDEQEGAYWARARTA